MGAINPLLQISTEALYEYKNPLLAGNIREAIEQYRESKDGDRLADRLQAIAKTFFNIRLYVKLEDMRAPAFITHEQLDDMSLIRYNAKRLSDSEHTAGKGLAAIAGEVDGWINPRTLKVGGIFAELKVNMTLSTRVLEERVDAKGDSNDEAGIVFLHELGHYLGYVMLATNQFTWYGVVDSLVRGVRGAATNDEAIKFIKTNADGFGFKVSGIEDLKGAAEDSALKVKLLSDIRATNPTMAYNGMSLKEAETVADELPAGVYGARATAMVMSRLSEMANHPAYTASSQYYGTQLALFAGSLLGGAVFLPLAVLGGVAFAYHSAVNVSPDSHPNPLTRLQRFRSLLLSDTKSSEITREQATKIADDLKVIDEEIARLNVGNANLVDWLADVISDTRKQSKEIEHYDSMISSLQNNSLYLRAAQLRNLKD
jgi:hypothetical protein